MKQHKWHKEIKHLADGGEIEYRTKLGKGIWSDWSVWDEDYFPEFNNDVSDEEYRIKPQPKELKNTLSCGCKSDYHGFPCEWDSNEGGINFGVLCEKHYWEWEAKPNWDCKEAENAQPKEPQYLYVYLDDDYEFSPIPLTGEWEYIGKIKLEE